MRETLLKDREFYLHKLQEMNSQIRQLTANANCVKGALEYINLKLAETEHGGDHNQHSPDGGPQSVGGNDSALLEQ